MSTHLHRRDRRPGGALLAGVCSGVGRALRWNVWVLRALFVGFLAIKTTVALISYGVLALLMRLFDDGKSGRKRAGVGLASPELSQRNKRIADLEQRFRDLENSEP